MYANFTNLLNGIFLFFSVFAVFEKCRNWITHKYSSEKQYKFENADAMNFWKNMLVSLKETKIYNGDAMQDASLYQWWMNEYYIFF